jgi:hypothetical protein
MLKPPLQNKLLKYANYCTSNHSTSERHFDHWHTSALVPTSNAMLSLL